MTSGNLLLIDGEQRYNIWIAGDADPASFWGELMGIYPRLPKENFIPALMVALYRTHSYRQNYYAVVPGLRYEACDEHAEYVYEIVMEAGHPFITTYDWHKVRKDQATKPDFTPLDIIDQGWLASLDERTRDEEDEKEAEEARRFLDRKAVTDFLRDFSEFAPYEQIGKLARLLLTDEEQTP